MRRPGFASLVALAAIGAALLLAVPTDSPVSTVPEDGLPDTGPTSGVRPMLVPSTTCGAWDGNPPNGTAPCSTAISVSAGDTFVGLVALNGAQTASPPGFSGSGWLSNVSWFENLTTASGPEIFAM